MELNTEGLSANEQRLAGELSELGVNPRPEQRTAIMAAVRLSQDVRPAVIHRWRLAWVGLVAVAILLASSVGAIAASNDALPSSPAYSVRGAVEEVRLALASPTGREQLRIAFANARIDQARAVLREGDRANARGLLHDSRDYLDQTKKDLSNLPAGDQGQIQNELNQAVTNEQQAEKQLNQEGVQGS